MRRHAHVWLLALILLLAAPVMASIDTAPSDGLGDVWQQRFNATGLTPMGDPDRDGNDNALESKTGTDPLDPSSRFGEPTVTLIPDATNASWRSALGARYVVQTSDTGLDGSWIDASPVITGNGGSVHHTFVPAVSSSAFIRLALISDYGPWQAARDAGHTLDSDADGYDDISEFLAKTDPFDPLDYLRFESLASGTFVRFNWETSVGIHYHLEASQSDESGSWTAVNEPLRATDATASHVVQMSPLIEKAQMFRLVATDPDSDADGVSDWEELSFGSDADWALSLPEFNGDAEAISSLLLTPPAISLYTISPIANRTTGEPGIIELRRSGNPRAITINISITDQDGNTPTSLAPDQTQTLTYGEETVRITIDPAIAADSLELRILPDPNYTVGESAMLTTTFLTEKAISVVDFGATGDGVTDDTIAIQSAINALESSSTHNTLFFPSGTYRLATLYTHNETSNSSYRILRLGFNDLAGRDLVFRGEPGAKLYSEVSPVRAQMLMVHASFRSLSFVNLTWEQDSVPLSRRDKIEPNGSDGVALLDVDTRRVEAVRFRGCHFINCHGAVFTYGFGLDLLGKLGRLEFKDTQILNPYGANTEDSLAAWGGGQQVYVWPWVGEAVYENCVFDGGGDVLGDPATSPGGKLKDGSHFGSPLRLFFRNNIVRRMGVEAVFNTNNVPFMAATIGSFTIPPGDGIIPSTIRYQGRDKFLTTFESGQLVNLRVPATPGATPSNTILEIIAVRPESLEFDAVYTDYPDNLAPGTLISTSLPLWLNSDPITPVATIENNVIDGHFPTGARTVNHAGIALISRGTVRNNFVTGFGNGILLHKEFHTPLKPASARSRIEQNMIITRNSEIYSDNYTYGTQSWSEDMLFRNNFVYTPVGYKTGGVTLRGIRPVVGGNLLYAGIIRSSERWSLMDSVGIGYAKSSSPGDIIGNHTRGFDAGFGRVQREYRYDFRVRDHQSTDDVVPIDWSGYPEY